MDSISFRCTSCKQVLKVSGDKAGRKAKCTKCGAELTIPKAEGETAKKPPPLAPAPPPAEEDEGGAYGLLETHQAPEIDLTAGKKEKKGEKKEKGKVQRKLRHKTIQHHEQWQKLKVGLILMFCGVCAWGLAYLLQVVFLAIGSFTPTEYSAVADKILLEPARQQGGGAGVGEGPALDRPGFLIGLLIGLDSLSLGRTLLTIAQVLLVLQSLFFLGGYGTCVGVPNRYGTRGLAIALLSLGAVNLILNIVFKLLPITGAMNYAMMPLVGSELAMIDANIDRVVPLHAFWAAAPFWELFLAILMQVLLYMEPVLFCLFLRGASLSWKDDWLPTTSQRMVELVFGQLFILITYYVLSLTGTSEVVVLVLRVVYILWLGFLLGFIIWFSIVLLQTRTALDKYIVATEEEKGSRGEDEEDYDDDE